MLSCQWWSKTDYDTKNLTETLLPVLPNSLAFNIILLTVTIDVGNFELSMLATSNRLIVIFTFAKYSTT